MNRARCRDWQPFWGRSAQAALRAGTLALARRLLRRFDPLRCPIEPAPAVVDDVNKRVLHFGKKTRAVGQSGVQVTVKGVSNLLLVNTPGNVAFFLGV